LPSLDFQNLLLDLLRFSDDEYVSICHKSNGGPFRTAVCAPTQALAEVKSLPEDADVYFGINPVKGPARRNGGRGKAEDVTRLAVLPADLDVKSGACPNLDIARAIIDDVSAVLGVRPSAVTHSGGGLHPYWVVLDGAAGSDADLAGLLKRWGRLVKAVAGHRGAKVDSVFDLPRVLRVPGTYNCKAPTNEHGPTPVVCFADSGRSLTVAELDQILTSKGVPVEEGDARGAQRSDHATGAERGARTSNPDDWEFADESCPYVQKWLDGIVNDEPIGGRHQWAASQAVRIACAWMLGCISENDYAKAQQLVDERLGKLRAETREVVPPYEVASLFQYGVERAATKTAAHAREELGGHKHVWPAPDHPYECAKRVVTEAKHEGRPLRYWNGTWFSWCGTHYRSTSVEGLRDRLYDLLAEAEYLGAKGDYLRWKPTPKKLNDVIDATRGLVAVPAGVGASCWIDGHTEPVIACANGLVRVADRELVPHTPEFFNTFALVFNFEPDAPAPKRWLDFLSEVFPDDPESAQTLKEWFGYILSGRTDLQKMLMVVGPPRSGKGTITRTLIALVGAESHAAVTDTTLAGDFGLAPLIDKTLAVLSDTRVSVKGKKLVETLLTVSGEDAVPVNRKYRDAVSVQLGTRFMIASNETPVFPDNSGAIVSRTIALSTPESWLGREDPRLIEALKKELPAIFLWALDGMDELMKSGRFTQPATGQEIVDLLSESASPIKQFINETCVFGPEATHFVSKQCLYERWKSWCIDHGYPPTSDVHLARALYAAFRPQVRSSRRGGRDEREMYYAGIALRTPILRKVKQ
jgi:putative DNA primase/helicase